MLASAAIRHIKNSGGMWVPGQNNGESVRSRFVAPLLLSYAKRTFYA